MEQCKINGQDVFIYGLEDIYDYIRKFVNDDFAESVEDIVEGKLSDKDDKIYDLEVELEEAQDEINGLETEADSLQEELDEAWGTIQELQENLAEANHEFDIDRCNL